MISFGTYYKNSILLSEGGNIFSDRRINKNEIVPTIKSLEKLTGLSLIDNTLGSTGKKETSGDIDLVIKGKPEDKDIFIKMLVNKGINPSSLKKTGIEVAYRAPIIGSDNRPTQEHIQVDFMFSENPEFLKFYYTNNEDVHKGSDRNILLSSIAKAKGLTLSMKGLTDRETKTLISLDPKIVTQRVLGDDATLEDIHSISNILKYLKKHYSVEDIKIMIGQAEETIGGSLL